MKINMMYTDNPFLVNKATCANLMDVVGNLTKLNNKIHPDRWFK